ncbi:CAP domain-containing protein [Streptomyces sp. NBC_00868]|uniref:CAP domain-containing protein n=1 Tax=unclassified Streptomyces TaxID=2593676 RepID=UPI0032443F50|nr:CAP domain-containing protein [Streptomyces sp. NBC_00868]
MGRHRLHAAPNRGGKRGTALRTGLLGVSVAVALGTAAVTTGMVPVSSSFPYVGIAGSGSADKTEAAAKPTPSRAHSTPEQQGGLANLSGRASAGTGTAAGPSASPSPSASTSAPASPSPSASASVPTSAPASASPPPSASAAAKASAKPVAKPVAKASAKPVAKPTAKVPAKPAPVPPKPPVQVPTAAPVPSDGHSAEEAAVVALVNQERAMAGCGPVRANPPLAALAGAFSKDMAVRGFFDHTDPDGSTPWDRAAKAGLSGLGGENIARGQGDAEAVMKAWMNSPGHKANILNCEFRTLGVGAYFAAGGPWWTQDFGF